MRAQTYVRRFGWRTTVRDRDRNRAEIEAALARLDDVFVHQRRLLSPRQLEIVRAWQRTDRFYEFTQRVARSLIDLDRLPEPALEAVLEIQQALDDSIRSAVLPFPLTVYRGIRNVRRTLSVDDAADAVGSVRNEDGYFATSVFREVAVDEFTSRDGAIFEVRVPAGTTALWVAGCGSAALRRQGELLLPEGLRTRIYAHRRDVGLPVLSMEVIAS